MAKLLNRRDVEVTPSHTSSEPQPSFFLGLPTELILKVLGDLDGQDLFNLSQLCRRLNTIASSAFLCRNNITDPTESIFLHSRNFEILTFLRNYVLFTSCDFFYVSFSRHHYLNEIRGLEHLVQKLSSLKEVALDFRDLLVFDVREDEIRFIQAIQSLFSNIIGKSCERLSISCHLSLHNKNWGKSQKARNGGSSFISRAFHALLAGPSRSTLPAHDHSGSLTFDPRCKPELKTFQINSSTLLEPPFLRWTIQIISISPIAHLTLENSGSQPFDWNKILSVIDSPSLLVFHVKDHRRELLLATLFSFLSRHPNVSILDCEGLARHQGRESHSFSHPKLEIIYVTREDAECLLANVNAFPSLRCIFLSSPPFSTEFDSSAMNSALKSIRRIVHEIDLCLTIPSESMAAMAWLDVGVDIDNENSSSARAELSLHCVTSLSLFEPNIGETIEAEMLSLLPKWLGLFPSLRCVMFFFRFPPGKSKVYKMDFVRSLAKACPKLEKVMIDLETRAIGDWLAVDE